MLAGNINREYINSLGVKGGTAAAAVETMLGEGFSCRIETTDEYVPEERPMWRCIKQPSGYAPLCDELWVGLRFATPVDGETRGALLRHLGEIKVASASTFCPPPRAVSSEYLPVRGVAESSLRAVVDELRLLGDAQLAYEKLLLQGFYCGFVANSEGESAPAKMVCTRAPSQVKFCYEAKVILDVRWPDNSNAMKRLYSALRLSQIKAVRSSCEIPVISRGSGKPL